ncbi:MAG: tyrosine-type recombinase/integrase [Thermoflexales bacterium]
MQNLSKEIVEQFLADLISVSDNTRAAYRAGLVLAVQANLSLEEDVLQRFAQLLEKRHFAKTTRQLYLTALRRMLEWLEAKDHLPAGFNRAKALARLRIVQGKARVGYRHRQPDPDLPRIVTYYDSLPLPSPISTTGRQRYLELLRDRAIMHTLYASAGRVSEIAALTRAQVADGRRSEILISGKGDKQRLLLLTPEAQLAIRRYCEARQDSHPGLFISHRRNAGRPLTRISIWRIVKRAAKALGLSQKGCSPHMFRHYRATQLLNEGMPLESVQAYLGHSSPQTTRIVYAHTHTAVLRDQLATFGLSPAEAVGKRSSQQ